MVAAFPVAELNRRRSPVLRVSLPDDPETPSRQQGSPLTPPNSTPTSLACACSQLSSDGIVTAIPAVVRLNRLSFYPFESPILTQKKRLQDATNDKEAPLSPRPATGYLRRWLKLKQMARPSTTPTAVATNVGWVRTNATIPPVASDTRVPRPAGDPFAAAVAATGASIGIFIALRLIGKGDHTTVLGQGIQSIGNGSWAGGSETPVEFAACHPAPGAALLRNNRKFAWSYT